MRFVIYQNRAGNLAAHSRELLEGRNLHHLFLSHWQPPPQPRQRCTTFLASHRFLVASMHDARYEDSTANWRALGYEEAIEYATISSAKHEIELELQRLLLVLDSEAVDAVAGFARRIHQAARQLREHRQRLDRLPDVPLFSTQPPTKSPYDFLRW